MRKVPLPLQPVVHEPPSHGKEAEQKAQEARIQEPPERHEVDAENYEGQRVPVGEPATVDVEEVTVWELTRQDPDRGLAEHAIVMGNPAAVEKEQWVPRREDHEDDYNPVTDGPRGGALAPGRGRRLADVDSLLAGTSGTIR